ncbi:MAG: ureidoglycolate lyase [Roseovarius sp.]
MTTITAQPLSESAFAPFGTVIARRPEPDMLINQGLCGRHHALALADITDGTTGISLFDAQPRELPYRLDMVERHPLGSQAFLPLYETCFLVIVAPDAGGRPGTPRAFLTAPGQGVQIARNTWHGVLTPLAPPGLFAVIDRIGEGPNLQEHWFDQPYTITAD